MNSGNTKKTKAGLFDSDNERFYDILLRFVPLTFFMIAVSVVFRLELYFSLFNIAVDVYTTSYIFIAVIGVTQLFFSSQKFYSKTIFGVVLSTFVSIEACLLLIFAQYHPILAFLAALISAGVYFGIRYAVRCLNEPNRDRIRNFSEKCRKVAFRLSAVVVAAALILPAFSGGYKEFFGGTLTDEEWSDFFEWYSSVYLADEAAPEDTNAELLADLAKWESLDVDARERLIRIIAELEKERLMIDHLGIEVNSAKMDKNTLAYYSPLSDNIYINYSYLDSSELKTAITTILHELHHAYVYYTIDTLDFDSPEVQNSFYYESARQWKENSESYVNADVSYYGYYEQPIERDARAYAEERVSFYMAYAENGG